MSGLVCGLPDPKSVARDGVVPQSVVLQSVVPQSVVLQGKCFPRSKVGSPRWCSPPECSPPECSPPECSPPGLVCQVWYVVCQIQYVCMTYCLYVALCVIVRKRVSGQLHAQLHLLVHMYYLYGWWCYRAHQNP